MITLEIEEELAKTEISAPPSFRVYILVLVIFAPLVEKQWICDYEIDQQYI